MSVRPWFITSAAWLPPCPQPLASWPGGSLGPWPGLWLGYGQAAVQVCAWGNGSGGAGRRKQGLRGCRPFWEGSVRPQALWPHVSSLTGPELRSPGWDTRRLLGGQADPGAAAQTPVSLQTVFREFLGDAAPGSSLWGAAPVPGQKGCR